MLAPCLHGMRCRLQSCYVGLTISILPRASWRPRSVTLGTKSLPSQRRKPGICHKRCRLAKKIEKMEQPRTTKVAELLYFSRQSIVSKAAGTPRAEGNKERSDGRGGALYYLSVQQTHIKGKRNAKGKRGDSITTVDQIS